MILTPSAYGRASFETALTPWPRNLTRFKGMICYLDRSGLVPTGDPSGFDAAWIGTCVQAYEGIEVILTPSTRSPDIRNACLYWLLRKVGESFTGLFGQHALGITIGVHVTLMSYVEKPIHETQGTPEAPFSFRVSSPRFRDTPKPTHGSPFRGQARSIAG